MSTIVTRSGKGTALTHTEVDANFTNLNTDKAEASAVILATQKGAVSGVCPLDATSKVSSTYLPSYVDDVLEYANYAALPATGETGKIYVALDTNKTYRWSGSAYIYITSGAVDSVAGKTGVVTLTSSDVGLGNVTNTSDTSKPISTATQAALDLKASLASPTLSNPTFTGTATLSGQLNLTNASNYNLYASGAGANYMAGALGIGAVPYAGVNVLNQKSITGAVYADAFASTGTVLADVTTRAASYTSYVGTAASAFALSSLRHFGAYQAIFGAGSTVTSQTGYFVETNLTGATNNYGFFGNIAAGTGRYNLYMNGTANNYMAGSLGIGTSSPTTKLTVAGAITITGAFALRGSYGAGAIASNFAAGDGALIANTTGTSNSAVGQSALFSNTTGTSNSAVGVSALLSNTTGINNSAVGVSALLSNTTGSYNSAVGVNALYYNTTGANNAAVGQGALFSNTTGAQNTAMGAYALLSNTTGAQNTALGLNALRNNTTGANNSALGMQALFDLTTTTIVATAIVNGTAYQIVTMGTTTSAQWIASGAVTGTVGETFTANATAGVGTGTVATSANVATQCLNNTALGYNTGRGITTGSGNTIIGANVTGLAAGLTNTIVLANGTGSIRVQSNATTITFADVIMPQQATTAAAPAYVKGGMYFDTTLNKMRIGGATAWETVTSV
jgi:hypothetical protein